MKPSRDLARMAMQVARCAETLGLREYRWWSKLSAIGKRLVWDSDPELLQPFVEIEFHGLRLRVPYSLTRDYVSKSFEPETLAVLGAILRPGDRVVDVGANIGAVSCLAASIVGSEGRVWAVEPDPRNLDFLVSNVRINGLRQVEVIAAAAGDSTGTASLYLGATGVLSSLGAEPGRASLEVPLVAVDALGIEGPVDLLKIDVEGAETLVLQGATKTIGQSSQLALLIEWNPSKLISSGLNPMDLPSWLESAGFRLEMLDGGPDGLEVERRRVGRGTAPPSWTCNLLCRRP